MNHIAECMSISSKIATVKISVQVDLCFFRFRFFFNVQPIIKKKSYKPFVGI